MKNKATPSKNPEGKPLPPVFKYKIEFDYLKKFTWGERIQIFLGKRARLNFQIATMHAPGKYQPLLVFKMTNDLEPKPFLEITPPN